MDLLPIAKAFLKVKTDSVRRKLFKDWVPYPRFSIDRSFYTGSSRYSKFSKNERFANLGAGKYFFHEKWDCYDFYPRPWSFVSKNYINWDFREGKSLPKKYKLLYISHVIEHIPSQDFIDFIDTIKNSLLPGGALRFVYPDANLAYNAYIESDISFFEIYSSKLAKAVDYKFPLEFFLLDYFSTEKRRNNNFSEKVAEEIAYKSKTLSKKSFLDYLTQGIISNNQSGMNHVNWFNHDKLCEILIDRGFSPYKSAFGQSKYAPMREVPLFDGWLPCLSAYTEATLS